MIIISNNIFLLCRDKAINIILLWKTQTIL